MLLEHLKHYILLDPEKGYPFGVAARHKAGSIQELHGPFGTQEAAEAHAMGLWEEWDDYAEVWIVRIETPAVGTFRATDHRVKTTTA